MSQSGNGIEQDSDSSAAAGGTTATQSRQSTFAHASMNFSSSSRARVHVGGTYEQSRQSNKGNGSFDSASNGSKTSLNNANHIKILNAIHSAEQLIPNFKKGDFPGICVIGDQSSGKTSLLEVLCGFSLPRGSGLVTRTPLEIALRPGDVVKYTLTYNLTPDNSNTVVTKHITDPNEIQNMIMEATRVVTGDDEPDDGQKRKGKKIVDIPLRLEVVGPEQPTLDLTDLPGIVQNVTEHQDESIKDSIMQMIKRYINGAMTIIVCVVPATSVTAANFALTLAKEADPERRRTLGVLTKADTASTELEALNKRLEGDDDDEIALDLGYYAVYCNAGGDAMSPQQWLSENREENWFSAQDALKGSKKVGTKVLGQDMATHLLSMLLKSKLVGEIQRQIDEHLAFMKEEQQRLPKKLDNERDAQNFMSDVYDSIASQFKELQRGDYAEVAEDVLKVRLHLKGFMNEFEKQMLVECAPSWFLTDDCRKEICEEYNEREGITETHPMGSVFGAMLHKHIDGKLGQLGKLDSLYKDLVQDIRDYILTCLKTLAKSQLETSPSMLRTFNKLLEDMIEIKKKEALHAVQRLAGIAKDTYPLKHPQWIQFLDYCKRDSRLLDADGIEVKLDTDTHGDNCGVDAAARQAKISKVIAEGGEFVPRVTCEETLSHYLVMLDIPPESHEGLMSSLRLLNVKSEVESGYLRQRMELAMHTHVLLREAIDVVPRMVILMLSTEVQEDFRKEMRSRLQDFSKDYLPLMESTSTVEKRALLDSNIEKLTEIQSDMEKIMIPS